MGYAGKNGIRLSDKQECQEILNTFFKYGNEIDTARLYGEGTTEQVRNAFSLTPNFGLRKFSTAPGRARSQRCHHRHQVRIYTPPISIFQTPV
jgi:hypothetical protein